MAAKKQAAASLPPALRCAVSAFGVHVAHSNRARVQVVTCDGAKAVYEAPIKDATHLAFCDDDRLLVLTPKGQLSLHSVRARSMAWSAAVCDSEPFGGMLQLSETLLVVGHASELVVVDLADGKVERRSSTPGKVHGLARSGDGKLLVSYRVEKSERASFGLFDGRELSPAFEIPGGYLGLRAFSPGGAFVYGFHGLSHTLVDVRSHETFALHKGLGHAAVFLDDAHLVEATKTDVGIDVGPRWERAGAIDLAVEHLAISKDGRVIAAVGTGKGVVWTREELLKAAGVAAR